MTLLVLLVAAMFLAMGIVALARPERVVALFGTPSLTPAGRNEVRAVYGGFGVACCLVLVWAAQHPGASGVFLALGAALWGMAAGRLVSFALERQGGALPALILVLELALGGVLVWAWLHHG